MNITFLKDCPASRYTGWSAYKQGDKATLKHGAILVEKKYAREGWEAPKARKSTKTTKKTSGK